VTVIVVTHAVEEAVYLSAAIAVMAPRPGRVVGAPRIDLPRPRDRADPRFGEIRRAILGQLRR